MWKFKEYPANWQEIRKIVLKRDNYRCRVCGETDTRLLEVCHVVSMSHGGSSEVKNLISKCSRCHAKEHKHHRFNKSKSKVLL